MATQIADLANYIEFTYTYFPHTQSHYLELLPTSDCSKEFERKIETYIKEFFTDLEKVSDGERTQIESNSGLIYFKTKEDFFDLIYGFLRENQIPIFSVHEYFIAEPDADPASPLKSLGTDKLLEAQIETNHAEVISRLSYDKNLADHLLAFAPIKPYPDIKQYHAHAYLMAKEVDIEDFKLSMLLSKTAQQIIFEEPLSFADRNFKHLPLIIPSIN